MNKVLFCCAVASLVTAFGQGQLRFETLGPQVAIPVFRRGQYGPGPDFSAQLYLVSPTTGALTALNPTTTFRAAGNTGAERVADRYVSPIDVTVPNVPSGQSVSLLMRVWRTSLGSYENSVGTCDYGQSAPFAITLGGGEIPASPLLTLHPFTLGHLECPYDAPQILGIRISLANSQIEITADQATDETRLLASTNLQTWIAVKPVATWTGLSRYQRIFIIRSRLSLEYYRLEEP